jgi:hypothetical protein
MRKSLLILTALASLTIANYSAKAATDEDGYRILHKGQKIQLTEKAYGFRNHDDLVAFQGLFEGTDARGMTPEKEDAFLASHESLRFDSLYVTILGTEKPYRVHVSLNGASYWMDDAQIPDEN